MKLNADIDDGEHTDYDGEPREYTWSVNLELPEHADDRARLVEDALRAVEQTAEGYFVNLVTHPDHGHPSGYLYDELDEAFGGKVEYGFVERCGCGGYVTRVHV